MAFSLLGCAELPECTTYCPNESCTETVPKMIYKETTFEHGRLVDTYYPQGKVILSERQCQ